MLKEILAQLVQQVLLVYKDLLVLKDCKEMTEQLEQTLQLQVQQVLLVLKVQMVHLGLLVQPDQVQRVQPDPPVLKVQRV